MATRVDTNALKQRDLAELLISPRTNAPVDVKTIQRWHDDGLPRHGSGPGTIYVWSEVLPWYLKMIGGENGPGDKARKLRAEADLAEMDAQQQAGELLLRVDVERTWSAFLGRLRDSLLGVPDRVAPLITPDLVLAERLDVLRKEIHQVMRDIAAEEEK